MMNEEQKQVVFRYIVSRDITVDLAIEIFDHMSSQIHDFMDQGENFYDAFETVRETWHEDLKVNPYLIFSYNKSKMDFKMKWSAYLPLMKLSTIWGLLVIILVYFSSQFFKMQHITTAAAVVFFAMILFHFIYNFKLIRSWGKTKKKYESYSLSIFDEGVAYIALAANFPNMIRIAGDWDKINSTSGFEFYFIYLSMFGFGFATAYVFYSYRKLKHSKEKIEPYLKYLHANPFYS